MSRRKYDDEFKLEAARLVIEGGRTLRSVEDSLGITPGVLKDWVKHYRRNKQVGVNSISSRTPAEEKVLQLEKELARVKRERNILKKAVAIFSTEPNQYSGS